MTIQNLRQKIVCYWQWIKSESNYSHTNPIKFLTSSLESSLCDYSDEYVLVTGNITVIGCGDDTKVAFKNCAPFRKCITNKQDFYWWCRTY